ncbi:MAG: membrane protein insertion efficiency factor YidD [bacterium]|nr:membrane protein insertion efficiency factor YidD [bacterium]
MKKVALKLIVLYQSTLSFDHSPLSKFFPGGFCRFRPSCSQYAYESIQKYGLIKGGLKGTWRICRCNPWGKTGWDPVK